MFKDIPVKLLKTLMLLRIVGIPSAVKLFNSIMYLYREFYIDTNITPVFKEFIVNFECGKEKLMSFKTDNLSDLIKIIEDIKKAKGYKP